MKVKPILIILFIISIFLCISAVSAENTTQYYVDSSVDVSGDGSQSAPFKTIEEAVNVVDETKTTEIYVNGSGKDIVRNRLPFLWKNCWRQWEVTLWRIIGNSIRPMNFSGAVLCGTFPSIERNWETILNSKSITITWNTRSPTNTAPTRGD